MQRCSPGCKVKCVATIQSDLTENHTYTVSAYFPKTAMVRLKEKGDQLYTQERFLYVGQGNDAQVIPEQVMNNCKCSTKEQWDNYKFSVRSMEQIDHDSIEKDLSPRNPMMIGQVEGEQEVYVYIHESVWVKAANCGMSETLTKLLTVGSDDHYWGQPLANRRWLPAIISCIRQIRQSPWSEGIRAKITVQKVNI
jgi:hypothetical protein